MGRLFNWEGVCVRVCVCVSVCERAGAHHVADSVGESTLPPHEPGPAVRVNTGRLGRAEDSRQ